MTIEKLIPTCNLNTVKDGRGGIFTFYPKDPIVEINFNIVKAGKIRGNHHHPEFDEYYSIRSNKGYGAKKHLEGIEKHGITKYHRKTFGICKRFA